MVEKLQLYRVFRRFPDPWIGDEEKVRNAVRNEIALLLKRCQSIRDKKIGLLVGSRGIRSIAIVVSETVKCFRAAGATVVIIPAMASHGGGTAEGQLETLRKLGISKATDGLEDVEFDARMETIELPGAAEISIDGKVVSSIPVRIAKSIMDVDLVFAINRDKPHTEFDGRRFASGLQKMLAIGISKLSAKILHAIANSLGTHEEPALEAVIAAASEHFRRTGKVLGGLALVENRRHELMSIRAATCDEIPTADYEGLELAREFFGQLPRELFRSHLLIVRWVGKSISGYGADSNITGRGICQSPNRPTFDRILYMDLTDDSGGNGLGAGLAEYATAKLMAKIDLETTMANVNTTGRLELGAMPKHIGATDRAAFEMALDGLPDSPIVVFIQSTNRTGTIYVSAAGAELLKDCGFEVTSAGTFTFDENGNFTGPEDW